MVAPKFPTLQITQFRATHNPFLSSIIVHVGVSSHPHPVNVVSSFSHLILCTFIRQISHSYTCFCGEDHFSVQGHFLWRPSRQKFESPEPKIQIHPMALAHVGWCTESCVSTLFSHTPLSLAAPNSLSHCFFPPKWICVPLCRYVMPNNLVTNIVLPRQNWYLFLFWWRSHITFYRGRPISCFTILGDVIIFIWCHLFIPSLTTSCANLILAMAC